MANLGIEDSIRFRLARNAIQNAKCLFRQLGSNLSDEERAILVEALSELLLAERTILEIVNNGQESATP